MQTCKFALPEMIQQKCHHKHQSPWPWSTQNTNSWTEDVSLVVSDWQTYKQPHLWYYSSWTWGTWHPCHFTNIAISPDVLITLSPPSGSQFASLATCPSVFQSLPELSLFSLPMLQQCTYLNCSSFFFNSGGFLISYPLHHSSFLPPSDLHNSERKEILDMGKKVG